MQKQIAPLKCGDLEGCLLTNIISSFHESTFQQKVGKPWKYEIWFIKGFSSLH